MAEPFAIHITAGAESDLRWVQCVFSQNHLGWSGSSPALPPNQGTRRLKLLRPNPVAGWELRLGDYRVLYDVDETQRVVTVQVAGEKQGNRFLVQGQEFTEHESD